MDGNRKFPKILDKRDFPGDKTFPCNAKGQKYRKGIYQCHLGSDPVNVLCMQHQHVSDIEPYYTKLRALVHNNLLTPCAIAWEGPEKEKPLVCFENPQDMQGLLQYCMSQRTSNGKDLFGEEEETVKFKDVVRDATTGLCYILSQNYCHGNVSLDSISISADGRHTKIHGLQGIKSSPEKEEKEKDLSDLACAFEELFKIQKKKMSFYLEDYLRRLKVRDLNRNLKFVLDHPLFWPCGRAEVFCLELYDKRASLESQLKGLEWPANWPKTHCYKKNRSPYDQKVFLDFVTMLRDKVLHPKSGQESVVKHLPPKLHMRLLEILEPDIYQSNLVS